MDPVYNYTHSYPYLRDQMHYWPHNYPPFPTQVYVNSPRPPVNHECWPWAANYGYASPVACHGCGNHNCPSTYYGWRPPYSHVPTVHCPGNSPFPVQYMPPPHYSMHQPQYEYEKNVPRNHHCCGCPNHQCHQNEQKNIRIEEEVPDMERRKNDSMVPFQFKNYPHPYPIVYVPRDFGNNKEHEKLNKSEHKEGKDWFVEAKPDEDRKDSEQQRNVWNLGSLDQRGEVESNREQQDGGRGRFPFPIIWMPYKTEENEKNTHKVNNVNQEPSQVPAKGSDAEQNLNINGEDNGGHVSSKLRDIPVKEIEHKEKERDASVKDGNHKVEKKLTKDGARSSSSSPKSSKLPPVCLRVDPLPRRKTSKGSSRSPSPPGDKQKLDQLSSNVARKVLTSDNEESREITENKTKEGDTITKIIEIADGVSTNQIEDKLKEENISLECCENGDLCTDEDVNKDEPKSSKMKLTDEEAAVVIQSAYRGFDVRKWAPVKKLKQIAKVREQIGDVKKRIQALEISSDIQYSSKERNIVAEIIMSLLLKLDTIQGLHPYVREVRKSVVRELVSLQEKLDSLLNEKSQTASVQDSTTRDEASNFVERGQESKEKSAFVPTKHDEEASKEPVGITPSNNANEAQSELPAPHQHDLDREPHCENLEISENSVNGEQMGKKMETEGEELFESCMDKGVESPSEPVIAKEDEQIEKVNKDNEASIAKKMEDCEGISKAQFEEGVRKDDQLPEEVAIEASISPETTIDPTDEENKEHMKLNEEVNVELEDKEMTTEEKMDNKIVDASFGPDEYSAPAQTSLADILEPYEAFDKRELPIEEATEGNDASGEEASDNSVEKEISPSQQGSSDYLEQEKIPVNDSEIIYEPEEKSEDPIIAQGGHNVIADIDDRDEALEEGETEHKEACEVAKVSITNTPLHIDDGDKVLEEGELEQKEAYQVANESVIDTPLDIEVLNEPTHFETSIGTPERDELIEANGKLIEENERLRDMMEKLIKSGQQQLTAISSLSGKVKDLERKLSKKKKLKTKACRAPRSCREPARGSLKEMSNGVAM